MSLPADRTALDLLDAHLEALWDGTDLPLPKGPVCRRSEKATRRPATIALATARPGTAAVEACRALADCLGVPFRFASLNLPDDEAPRRRRAQGLSGGA